MGLMRPLYNNELAAEFAKGILGFSGECEIAKAVDSIVCAELQLDKTQLKPTSFSPDFRNYEYRTDESRVDLREKIFDELMTKTRLDDDDSIELGKGGILPLKSEVKKERQAFIIIGLPASGKSSVANIIADHYGALILDSDFAKRKFPEFRSQYGPSLVHEEASMVVFGEGSSDERSILEACIYWKYNIVIPKIGHDSQSLLLFANALKEEKYSVHLVLVSLDRVKATQRAYRRYKETGRYVPLSKIIDVYGNNPILSYYRVRDDACWTSYLKISTDEKVSMDNTVEKDGKRYTVIHESALSPAKLFQK
ncbi:zeta toxin family protein [Anaeroarcus burkinensis]|uniref:zeta toxin family protein n=1 Tax=Anaeroarcus burkinensis TaxID=82376 RepID=UPI000418BE32|nr:zeta toxin family protein [Anaeroarcus burkinensis]